MAKAKEKRDYDRKSRGLGVKSQDQEIKKKFQGKSNFRETQWESILKKKKKKTVWGLKAETCALPGNRIIEVLNPFNLFLFLSLQL